MWWMISGVVAILTVLAAGLWFLAPTMGTFRGPDFEPASKDDASVERAQQSGTSAGAGGAGAGI
jgi:hypothetical protein